MLGEIKSSWDVTKQMYEAMGTLPAIILQLSPHRRITDQIGRWRMKIAAKVIGGILLWILSIAGTAIITTIQTLKAVPNDVKTANAEIRKLAERTEAANNAMAEDIKGTKNAVNQLAIMTEKAIDKLESRNSAAINENRRMIYDHLRDVNNGRSKR